MNRTKANNIANRGKKPELPASGQSVQHKTPVKNLFQQWDQDKTANRGKKPELPVPIALLQNIKPWRSVAKMPDLQSLSQRPQQTPPIPRVVAAITNTTESQNNCINTSFLNEYEAGSMPLRHDSFGSLGPNLLQ